MSDVDTFLARFNRASNYKDGDTKLQVGNYVTIQDGTYNAIWEIAGFDMENNQTAADGTVYDNGYGICMIPKTQVTTAIWNDEDDSTRGGYIASNIHNFTNYAIATELKTVLGSHIIRRNVLLSSNTTSGSSSAYIWTTAYATLMSIGQMTGKFAIHNTKFDDGEANYKLPIFNVANYYTGSKFWSRGVTDSGDVWVVTSTGTIYNDSTNLNYGVRPLIYLR